MLLIVTTLNLLDQMLSSRISKKAFRDIALALLPAPNRFNADTHIVSHFRLRLFARLPKIAECFCCDYFAHLSSVLGASASSLVTRRISGMRFATFLMPLFCPFSQQALNAHPRRARDAKKNVMHASVFRLSNSSFILCLTFCLFVDSHSGNLQHLLAVKVYFLDLFAALAGHIAPEIIGDCCASCRTKARFIAVLVEDPFVNGVISHVVDSYQPRLMPKHQPG